MAISVVFSSASLSTTSQREGGSVCFRAIYVVGPLYPRPGGVLYDHLGSV